VGYSLTDPNFKQIYDRISRLLGAAQRPAFATSFGSSSEAPPHVRVISFDGTIEEKTTALRCWLDELVDVAREPVSLLLADAADSAHVATPEMLELRARLNRVGDEVVQRARRPMVAADARILARVATSLMEHGWRASCGNDRLLEMIATKLDSSEREPLVRFALAQADSHDSIARLEAILVRTPQG
jgi:hypothetical protein